VKWSNKTGKREQATNFNIPFDLEQEEISFY